MCRCISSLQCYTPVHACARTHTHIHTHTPTHTDTHPDTRNKMNWFKIWKSALIGQEMWQTILFTADLVRVHLWALLTFLHCLLHRKKRIKAASSTVRALAPSCTSGYAAAYTAQNLYVFRELRKRIICNFLFLSCGHYIYCMSAINHTWTFLMNYCHTRLTSCCPVLPHTYFLFYAYQFLHI